MVSFIWLCLLLGAGHLLRSRIRLLRRLYLPSCVVAGLLGLAFPLALWILLFAKLFPHLPAMFATVLPIGFEGGHGTAAGMAETFSHCNWPAGKDFALTSATFGVISAIVVGMTLVNWAVRKGYVRKRKVPEDIGEDDSIGIIPLDSRPSAGRLTVNSDVIESFSLHIIIVAIAVGLGYLAKQLLLGFESMIPYLARHKLLAGFPLFPLCLFGGLAVQLCADKFDRHNHIDIGLIRRIQNASLDFLVVAAVATTKIEVVLSGLIPLVMLAGIGIIWNIFCLMVIAPRAFSDSWFERAITEMGMAMGVTATGLLLLRVVDPDYETPAAEAFASKQILHEPFMGGGLWTAAAVPLIFQYGPDKIFLFAATVLAFWLLIIFSPRIFRAG